MIDEREPIRRIVTGELLKVRDRVERSDPWSAGRPYSASG